MAKKDKSEKKPEKKIDKKTYNKALAKLQADLVSLQGWIVEKGLRVVVIFEGRDAAGKGGVIKRITPEAESACVPHRRTRHAHGTGEDPVVLRAIHCESPEWRVRWCCTTGAGTTGPAWSG